MLTDEIIVVPIQIRCGLVVKVQMPANLTPEEAEKIAKVVKAMAVSNGRLERDDH